MPFIDGQTQPRTAEELMRSRFTAYSLSKIPYIIATCHPVLRTQQNPADLLDWCKRSEFKHLQILSKQAGKFEDQEGKVHFIAWIKENGRLKDLNEISDFEKVDGKWTYKSGRHQKTKMPGPNDPCPCQSGKKFKKCCG